MAFTVQTYSIPTLLRSAVSSCSSKQNCTFRTNTRIQGRPIECVSALRFEGSGQRSLASGGTCAFGSTISKSSVAYDRPISSTRTLAFFRDLFGSSTEKDEPLERKEMSKWWDESTVAIVTGGNKGIGYEIAKTLASEGVTCVLTARSEERGKIAAAKIFAETGKQVVFQKLDVTDKDDCVRLADFIRREYSHFDILVNNAGFAYHGSAFGAQEAQTTIETNVMGVMNVCETLKPLLHYNAPHRARIVNVCSMAGKLKIVGEPLRSQFAQAASHGGRQDVMALMQQFIDTVADGSWKSAGWPNSMYGVSKLGAATYTRILANELQTQGVLVSACCPGWCATDMSSWGGRKSAAQGADTPVWLALAAPDSIPGAFWSERQRQAF